MNYLGLQLKGRWRAMNLFKTVPIPHVPSPNMQTDTNPASPFAACGDAYCRLERPAGAPVCPWAPLKGIGVNFIWAVKEKRR